MITEEEQEKLKQLYVDLFKDVKDIAQSSADGDAEYWADLFKVDTTPEMDPDDEKTYGNIIELTFNAYQDNLATVSKLEKSADNFWEYAFETGSFNVEKYRRAIAIITELDNVIQSLHPSKEMAEEAGIAIVTGDTKVVNRGHGDGVFINTSGVGVVAPGVDLSGAYCRPGDAVLVKASRSMALERALPR